jgi:hypothetical protein
VKASPTLATLCRKVAITAYGSEPALNLSTPHAVIQSKQHDSKLSNTLEDPADSGSACVTVDDCE